MRDGGGGEAHTRRPSWWCGVLIASEKQLFFPQNGQEGNKTGREQLGSHQRNVLSASICSVGFVLLISLCSFQCCVLLLIHFYAHACVWKLAACRCCSLDSCVCLSEWVILHCIESIFPVSSEIQKYRNAVFLQLSSKGEWEGKQGWWAGKMNKKTTLLPRVMGREVIAVVLSRFMAEGSETSRWK